MQRGNLSMRRLIGISAYVLVLFAQLACRSDSINSPNSWFVYVLQPGDGAAPFLAVGDTITYTASAQEFNFGITPATDSHQEPLLFRWSSADAAVVQVDQFGVVRAVAPGLTRIQADFTGPHGGRSSAAPIQVVPRTSVVTVTLSRDTVFVGDTVRAVGRALDSAGRPVAGAVLRVAADQRLTTLGAEGTTIAGPGGYRATVSPVTVIYRADIAGVVEVVALRPYLRFSQTLEARANLIVLPHR